MSSLSTPVFRALWGRKESDDYRLDEARRILVIRQHNQLGDLLASTSLFRALKQRFPFSEITLIVSPPNKDAVLKNKYIDHRFIFDKSLIKNTAYLKALKSVLRKDYDLCIVPVVVSNSFTSNLMAGLSDAKVKIGISSFDGIKNESDYFFTHRVKLDWRTQPDMHVGDRIMDIVRPFGIDTDDFRIEISFDEDDLAVAKKFIRRYENIGERPLIGIHSGAGKLPNRWDYKNFITLIEKLRKEYNASIYLTGTNADLDITEAIKKSLSFSVLDFLNKSIPEAAALISLSDLFVTNDTGVMHVAGSTATPQISLFGPTNPFQWAPVGKEKHFLRNSDIIDDITVEEVFSLCGTILSQSGGVKRSVK